MAARKLGVQATLIEIDKFYCDHAMRRIAAATAKTQQWLF